jgi:hypothetical protein
MVNRTDTGFCLTNVPSNLNDGQIVTMSLQDGTEISLKTVWIRNGQAGFSTDLGYGHINLQQSA